MRNTIIWRPVIREHIFPINVLPNFQELNSAEFVCSKKKNNVQGKKIFNVTPFCKCDVCFNMVIHEC